MVSIGKRATGMTAVREPRALTLAAYLLAAALVALPLADGGQSPAGQCALVLLLAVAAAAALLPPDARPPSGLSPWCVVGAALIVASTVQTIHPDRTVQSLLLLYAYLLAGTLAFRGVRTVPGTERLLLAAILLTGALTTGVGFLQLLSGGQIGLYASLLIGPFGYPNAMAGFLLLAGGAALAIACGDRHPGVRAMAVAGGLLICCGLWFTRSRGALLAAIVGFGTWAVIERRNWLPQRPLWRWMGGVGALAGSALLLAWGDPSWFAGWRFGDPTQDSSLLWRWRILGWTWTMVQDNAWWGVGPGAFPVALAHYQLEPYVSGKNPHNLYLELAAEYGLLVGLLVVMLLVGFLCRLRSAINRTAPGDLVRGRRAALLATLLAFSAHSAVDLDWSYPSIAVAAATLLGLAAGHLGGVERRRRLPSSLWRIILVVTLTVASGLSITRYYATTLVGWGRDALLAGDTTTSHRYLEWAIRLNPLSYPAHQGLARTRVRAGNPAGAVDVAERAARLAPLDPNSQYLAGEIAAATGQWAVAVRRFQAAVDRAPFAQLRFHTGLIESTASGGNATEAQRRYGRATEIFTPERVVAEDGRCLAPGDRYLLARASRVVARLHAAAGDTGRHEALMATAMRLAEPDPRGICVTRGRVGHTAPETAMEGFWRALGEGGWSEAANFVNPDHRVPPGQTGGEPWVAGTDLRRARVLWIAGLTGDEYATRLRFEVEMVNVRGERIVRCAHGDTRLVGRDWFVDAISVVEARGCWP